MKPAVLVVFLLCAVANSGCTRTESRHAADSQKYIDTLMTEMFIQPQTRKVELLALKYGVPPGVVSNFVADYRTAFPDPTLTMISKSTNSVPAASVTEKIQALASRHGVPVQEVASIVADYEMWDSAERRNGD